MEYRILNKIKSPQDVKKLNNSDTSILCEEIRDCIINTVSNNGGHLASNLGTVELTVALHKAFSSPEDAIIFDVGHQSYTHKLLTGRFEQFNTLRKEGGISGFMRPDESEHDPFITGHSSNSISAAYGIYKAKRILGEVGNAVAVIGDGAMTGGMAYEALNNIGNEKNNFIIVLNDNKMSISKNVGALSRTLTKLRNKPKYHRFKFAISRLLLKIPMGIYLNRVLFRIKEILKSIVYKENIFSSMGFNYLGPVDGHNVSAMKSLFEIAKSYNRPSLIHVITVKGKGYSFAESNPNNYHGVAPFDINSGAKEHSALNFSAVAGETLLDLASTDPKICAITAAMTEGTGLTKFAKNFKSRFFDVGIAEQHAVTFAAGLAKQGLKPYFAVYSSFLQRAYDQLIHDAAIGNFPIRLLIDRAGIVGEDGETHQGIFDVSYLTNIPNITVFSPADYNELKYRIEYTSNLEEISAIRYPRGSEPKLPEFDYKSDYTLLEGDSRKLIITYGTLFSQALKAKSIDNSLNVLKLNKIFPIDKCIFKLLEKFDEIHIYEETQKSGGIGEHLAAILLENSYTGHFSIHAIEDKFLPASTIAAALESNGLDFKSMLKINGGY